MESVYTLNEVTLIGKLARDPEIQQLTAKFQKGNFTVITSIEAYDKEKGKIFINKFIRMESIHPLIIKQMGTLKQGNIVYAKGYVDPQEWTNAAGVKQYKTAIVCSLLVNGEYASVANPATAMQSNYSAVTNVTTVTAIPIQSVEERLNTPIAVAAEFTDDSFGGEEDVPF